METSKQSKAATKVYLTKEQLFEEYNKCLEVGYCTEKMTSYFEKIARRFSTVYKNNFGNTSDWNAIVNFAVAEAWQKWNLFDPNKTDNIFSFYTTMIANDMRTHYRQLNRGKGINISIDVLMAPKKE